MKKIDYYRRWRASAVCAALLVAGGVPTSPVLADEPAARWLAEAAKICTAEKRNDCDDDVVIEALARTLQTRQVALRAASRGNRYEQAARGELLQGLGLCNREVIGYCNKPTAACGVSLGNICNAMAQQRQSCVTSARLYCKQQRLGDCGRVTEQHCPTVKKQSLDEILARHDELNENQKGRLRQFAQTLQTADRSQLGAWVGQIAGLLGLR